MEGLLNYAKSNKGFKLIALIVDEDQYAAIEKITMEQGYNHGGRPSLSATIKHALYQVYPEVKQAWKDHWKKVHGKEKYSKSDNNLKSD